MADGISIFSRSEFCNPKLTDLIDSFFDYDLSVEKIRNIKDPYIFSTLQGNLKANKEVIKTVYERLKDEAEINFKHACDYEMISPYGGLDVDIIEVPELLYGYIQKCFDKCKRSLNEVINLFNLDFPEYINKNIEECSHALYIIKHRNKYKILLDLEQSICEYEWNLDINIDKVNKQKVNKKIKLNKLIEKREILSNKKYNLFEVLKGKKKIDKVKCAKISKLIQTIKLELSKICDMIYDYEIENNYYTDLKEDYGKLEKSLKKPFKNFSIKEDFMDIYIHGKFGKLVSLEKLINTKSEYEIRLKNLLQNRNKIKRKGKEFI